MLNVIFYITINLIQVIGESAGETVEIAIDMAAREGLTRYPFLVSLKFLS